MTRPPDCQHLLDHYAALRRRPEAELSLDERRGVLFNRAELAASAGETMPLDLPTVVIRWTLTRARIEQFTRSVGRVPTNNRRPAGSKTANELQLAEWTRTQRRSRLAGRLCSYQQARLDCLDGFSWDPLEDRWRAKCGDYRSFCDVYRAAPSDNGKSKRERALADWATRQRLSYWTDSLSDAHIQQLTELPIWTWGPPRL